MTSVSLLLSLLLLSYHSTLSLGQCGSNCKFRFCSPDVHTSNRAFPRGASLPLHAPKMASFPFVCRPKRRIGRVMKTGQARVSRPGVPAVEISKWRPAGLTRKFSKRYFQLKNIPLSREDSQGIWRAKDKGNGLEFLDGTCVVLPIEMYEGVSKRNLTKNVRGKKNDCLAFVATIPDLVIDIYWSDAEDLDLIVKGPGSVPARTSGDVESDCRGGQETVVVKDVVAGTYEVVYKHHYDEDHEPPPGMGMPGMGKMSTVSRPHWNYLFCSNRMLVVRDKVKKEKKRPFRYLIKVSFKGRLIWSKSGKAFVRGHGKIGMFNIVCRSVGSGLGCIVP